MYCDLVVCESSAPPSSNNILFFMSIECYTVVRLHTHDVFCWQAVKVVGCMLRKSVTFS